MKSTLAETPNWPGSLGSMEIISKRKIASKDHV